MPKVRMVTTSAGPEGTIQAGQVVPVDAKEAKALIDGGYAEPVEEKSAKRKEAGSEE